MLERRQPPHPVAIGKLMAVIAGCVLLSLAAVAQTTSLQLTTPVTIGPQPAAGTPSPLSNPGSPFSNQGPFFGATPVGQPTPGVLPLSALDAIDRGLRYNLGLLLSGDQAERARGARRRALSDLLPNVTARLSASEQQVNLAALGFPASLGTAFGLSPIVGPFNVFDARASATQSLLDLAAANRTRAATEDVRAADWNYRDAREFVVLVVGGEYLQVIADAARAQAATAQFDTAQAVYKQSVDLKKAGVVAAIDVLRAQVEMQSLQQRLLVVNNQLEKQKLALARVIGLPQGQRFTLTTQVPYQPAPEITLEEALQRAFATRADYQQALALEQSAERNRAAAVAGYYPSLKLSGDYGVIGNKISSSHGTFTAAADLKIPIFQGGKVQGDVQQADALLHQRQQELADLRARIENDVRTALLDLKAAAEQVQVAQNTVGLAEEQLTQARDRFAAGVANNIDVVQAQEAVATAHENYISSLNAHNLAKLTLARALGDAEAQTRRYLGGK